jgi:hypothetical protein
MPLLLYCVTLLNDAPTPQSQGLGAVEVMEIEGLRCYFSRAEELQRQLGSPQGTKKAALAFYGVNQNLFRHVAIVPFRFPALVEDEAALRQEVAARAVEYRAALERLADVVQMEARLKIPPAIGAQPVSGAEYLRAKQERERQIAEAVERLRAGTGGLGREWKQRRQRDEVRLYALVTRQDYGAFVENARAARPSGDIECQITGPWPATEFLGDTPETVTRRGVAPEEAV